MTFAKEDPKILTVTIDENGDLVYLKTPLSDVLLELGTVVTKRASHVEPVNIFQRIAFRALRLFGDKNRVADWTRTWQCDWLVDTRPVGGPVLTWADVAPSKCAPWMDKKTFTTHNRQEAIDVEIIFLNEFFLRR